MFSKKLKNNLLLNLFIVLSIFLLDRFSKIYVIYLNKKFFGSELFVSKFLNITLIWNEGIAFGLLSFNETIFYNVLTLVILFIILIIFFMLSKSYGLKKYSLLMILGGAIGNIYDRIFYRAVPDFIDFHIKDFHWFIFNVADIFITIGVLLVILYEITNKNTESKL